MTKDKCIKILSNMIIAGQALLQSKDNKDLEEKVEALRYAKNTIEEAGCTCKGGRKH